MKLAIILGTRPEIIKMAPLIRACEKQKINFFVLHTGQHFDYELDKKIFKDLELRQPKYNLHAGGKSFAIQIGLMISRMTSILKKEHATVVVVQGDTNSVLTGALAASRIGIKIAHHEAGLRSHDISMPEEINRILTDHIADYLFAPTKNSVANLRREGINLAKIYLTGNTVVDAVMQHTKLAKQKSRILHKLELKHHQYVLATSHRAENVDLRDKLHNILNGLDNLANTLKLPIIFPIHPRTRNNIKKFSLKVPPSIRLLKPQGYLDFLNLEANAKLIVTDSGGLQEEACILKVPCVTIRENTERPETIKTGMNILAGTDPERIVRAALKVLKKQKRWSNPFGDGKAGEKIINHLKRNL